MNRRKFLAALIAAPVVVKALGIASIIDTLTPEMVNYEIGYVWDMDYTWLRTSVILPDGREFRSLTYGTGDLRRDPTLLFAVAEQDKSRFLSHL